MRWSTTISGWAAFAGVWFCLLVLGDLVLNIDSLGWGMVWGVLALIAANRVERWIRGPSSKRGGVRGR